MTALLRALRLRDACRLRYFRRTSRLREFSILDTGFTFASAGVITSQLIRDMPQLLDIRSHRAHSLLLIFYYAARKDFDFFDIYAFVMPPIASSALSPPAFFSGARHAFHFSPLIYAFAAEVVAGLRSSLHITPFTAMPLSAHVRHHASRLHTMPHGRRLFILLVLLLQLLRVNIFLQ